MGNMVAVVMLSTWNGERYLMEQLESLAAQEGDFSLKLKIRDDGSTDGTLALIKSFCGQTDGQKAGNGTDHGTASPTVDNIYSRSPTAENRHPRFSVSFVKGENLGYVRSFFELLLQSDVRADVLSDMQGDGQTDASSDRKSDAQSELRTDGQAQWYAFCDQDDVWQPDKLNRAIQMLTAEAEGAPDVPLLYASRLQLVDGKLQPLGHTRMVRRTPTFANALVENIATGATLVMNRSARDLLVDGIGRMMSPDVKTPVLDVLLHDWWCYLVISAFGKVVYDTESRILYRQHEENAVGQKHGFLARQKLRLRRFAKRGNVRGITRQAQLVYTLYSERLPSRSQRLLRRFLDRDSSFWKQVAYAFHPDAKRQTWYDDWMMRLLVLLGRI